MDLQRRSSARIGGRSCLHRSVYSGFDFFGRVGVEWTLMRERHKYQQDAEYSV